MGRPKGSGAGELCHWYRHGGSGTRLHRIWRGMKRRCLDEKERAFPRYGGSGISVCPEWDNFPIFRDWALSNGYQDHLTIDRIDGKKGYEPSNCRWASYKTQNRNRSMSVFVNFRGKSITLAELSETTGVEYHLLKQRIRKLKWDVERAVSAPSMAPKKRGPKRKST